MSRSLSLLVVFLLPFLAGQSQYVTFYFDQNHYVMVSLNQLSRMSAEKTLTRQTSEILDNTKRENNSFTQLLLARELVYKSLTEVNEAVKDGLQVKRLAVLLADIVDEAIRIEKLVAEDPDLLLFAQKATKGVRLQAVDLYHEVNTFLLKGGVGALMNYNTRDELLRSVTIRLQLLRGSLFGLYRSLYWTKLRGSWKTLNPFSHWVNQDRLIIHQILYKTKTLKS